MSRREHFAEPVRAARAHELALARTAEAIERRRLPAGSRLPGLGELAEELGLSRPTVREGLRELERAGVVSVRRGGGGGIYLVSELLPTPALSTDELDEVAIVNVVVARRVLETAIVERATVVADEEDFAAIERTVALLAANLGSDERARRADAMFHRAVVRATHSRALERALAEIDRLLTPIRTAYPPDAREHRRTLRIHTAQLQAMRARDLEAVREICDRHFRLLETMIARRRGVTWAALFGAGR